MGKSKYPKELVDYTISLLEEGHTEGEAQGIIKNERNMCISKTVMLAWFHSKRSDFLTVRREPKNNMLDIERYKRKVDAIKRTAKAGSLLAYKDEVVDNGTVKYLERTAIIIGVYKNFILTEAGCVQFNDIKGVIKVGQEEQRQKTSI